ARHPGTPEKGLCARSVGRAPRLPPGSWRGGDATADRLRLGFGRLRRQTAAAGAVLGSGLAPGPVERTKPSGGWGALAAAVRTHPRRLRRGLLARAAPAARPPRGPLHRSRGRLMPDEDVATLRLAVAIPTYERPELLRRLVASLIDDIR